MLRQTAERFSSAADLIDHFYDLFMILSEILPAFLPVPELLKAFFLSPVYNSKTSRVSLVANRIRNDGEGEAVYKKLDSVVYQFLNAQIGFAGSVPQDSSLEKAVRAQKIVSIAYPGSKSAKAFTAIARQLLDDDDTEKPRGFSIRTIFDSFMKK